MARGRGTSASTKSGASRARQMAARESTPEEAAMGIVLRMLASAPNLPQPFFNIARGMLLLDKPDMAATAAASAYLADDASHPQPAHQARGDGSTGARGRKNATTAPVRGRGQGQRQRPGALDAPRKRWERNWASCGSDRGGGGGGGNADNRKLGVGKMTMEIIVEETEGGGSSSRFGTIHGAAGAVGFETGATCGVIGAVSESLASTTTTTTPTLLTAKRAATRNKADAASEEIVDEEAACAARLERSELRDWAKERRRGSTMQKARETLEALRDGCMKASPGCRKVVLAHLRHVEDPSKVCRNLGMVTGALIDQLEITGGDRNSDSGRGGKDDGRNNRVIEVHNNGLGNGGGSDSSGSHSAFGCRGGDADCNVKTNENSGGGSGGVEPVGAGKPGVAGTDTIHMFETAPAPAAPAVVGAGAGAGAAGATMETSGEAPAAAAAAHIAARAGAGAAPVPVARAKDSSARPDSDNRILPTASKHPPPPPSPEPPTPMPPEMSSPLPPPLPRGGVNHGGARSSNEMPCSGVSTSEYISGSELRSAEMLAKFDAVERKIGEMAGRMAASVAAVDAVVAESTGGCADLSTCGLRCVARGGGGSMSAVLDEVPPAPPRNGWQGQAPTAGERQQRPEKGEEEEEEEEEEEWEEEEARREKEVGTMGTLVDDSDDGGTERTPMQDVQEMLQQIDKTPPGARDFDLEDDLCSALKEILSWNPPPVWERNRARYNSHLVAAAGLLLKKAMPPDGFRGCWPMPPIFGSVIGSTSRGDDGGGGGGGGGIKLKVFRRETRLRWAAGGGVRSKGVTMNGVWSFAACIYRYASKPPVLKPTRAIPS